MAGLVPKLPSQLYEADELSDTDLAVVQQALGVPPVKKVTLGRLKTFFGGSSFDGKWTSLTEVPSTLAGFGITDGLTAAAAAAAYQTKSSELSAIAALSTQAFGRGLLEMASAAALAAALSLGSSAYLAAGSANGVATLDSTGRLSASQLPDLAVSDYLGNVSSQSAMLALVGQKGDWCVRADTGTTWIITGADPTLIGGWTQLAYPASPVSSVAGKTGAVTISNADVGLGNVENTALSTWAGSGNLTTLGTIASGVWHGTQIADAYIASAATWNSKVSFPGFGTSATTACVGNDARLSDARPASDVYSWAKAATKPSYTYSEVGADAAGAAAAITLEGLGGVPATRTVAGKPLSSNITLSASDVSAEAALGNPAADGYLLSSTTTGVRSWVPQAAATVSQSAILRMVSLRV